MLVFFHHIFLKNHNLNHLKPTNITHKKDLKSITTTAPSLNVGTIGSGVNPNKSLAPQIARGALSSQFTDVTNKINYYKATTQIQSKAVQFSLIVPF